MHSQVEESIEFVDKKSIQNTNEVIKELYLHLDYILLKVSCSYSNMIPPERIQRAFVINNPKLLSINMLVDSKMDRIISEFIVKNYHQTTRKRSTSVFPDESKSLLKDLNFKDDKCKIVYLRTNRPSKQIKSQSIFESNTLEVGVVYAKAENNEITCHPMLYIDTGNSISELQKEFSNIF